MSNDEIIPVPVSLKRNGINIEGILRVPEKFNKLLIFSSARSGTRIGPHRMFVEIALALQEKGIGTFCVEFPPLGDSSDFRVEKYQEIDFHGTYIKDYFDILFEYIHNNFQDKTIILSSISTGCIPLLQFSLLYKVNYIIYISPYNDLLYDNIIDANNLKIYISKLRKIVTFKKLFTGNLNFKKIFNNILVLNTKKNNTINLNNLSPKGIFPVKKAVFIFAENDDILNICLKYKNILLGSQKILDHKTYIIKNCDHSFYTTESMVSLSGYLQKAIEGL